MSKKLTFLLGISFSFASFAASHMIVIGGGGEPDRDYTIFDQELNNAANFVQQSKWNTRISFNGGHAKTEGIAQRIAAKSLGKNTDFTAESYEAIIADYEKKITSGQIKQGDQILLMISSHGSQKSSDKKTHYISTSSQTKTGISDLNTLQGSTTVSLDRLEKLTKLAESKGINLGILDFSCHSGLTQKLANKNTCVISSTGPDHFSWGGASFTFSAKFTEYMKSGKSLEDVFLDAMKNKRDTSFPMISSPIGQELQETMYPLISPYLYDTRSKISTDKMKQYYSQRYAKDRCESFNDDYNALIDFTHDIENISSQAKYTKLRGLLAQYKSLTNGIIQNTKIMNAALNPSVKKQYCDTSGVSGGIRYCISYSKLEILNIDVDNTINLYNKQYVTASKSRRDAIAANIRIYQQIRRDKDLLLKDQRVQTANRYWDQSQALKSTEQLANDIATEAQKAYTDAYRTIKKEEGSTGPCARIKL